MLLLAGGVVSGLLGLGLGYLTLRLKGVFFSIATLALSVVLQTLIINWEFVGGAKGISIIRPATMLFFSSYVKFLFIVMLCLAVAAMPSPGGSSTPGLAGVWPRFGTMKKRPSAWPCQR